MSWTDAATGLSTLDPEARQKLNLLAPADIQKGTILFRPGNAVKGYVIVLTGKIAVNLIGPTGRDILLYRVEPGQSCIQSTLGLMGGEDYSGEATAETDASIILLPRHMFLDLIDSSPAFRRLVFTAFATRMQSMMHLLERVAFQKVEARLASYLLDQADNTGELHITQANLATAIGSAREVISRRLEALETRGCIRRERGRINILNPELLRYLADETAM
ncbi:MAG: Crp/Fnr family transcriptional regulator [Paracoccaceae bacterium]